MNKAETRIEFKFIFYKQDNECISVLPIFLDNIPF